MFSYSDTYPSQICWPNFKSNVWLLMFLFCLCKKKCNWNILTKTVQISLLVFLFKVLQCSMDRELNLYSDTKEQTNPVASLVVFGLTSQPIDHETNGLRKHASSDAGLTDLLIYLFWVSIKYGSLPHIHLQMLQVDIPIFIENEYLIIGYKRNNRYHIK